jgi:hypothetical protein
MNTMLRTEETCNRIAAGAIAAPTPGELRPLHSEIVNRAVQRERGVQVQIAEQVRLRQMRDEDYWRGVERDQGAETEAINAALFNQRKATQRSVAAGYAHQIDVHGQLEAGQRAAEEDETARRAANDHFVDHAARQQEERQRQLTIQRTRESFNARCAVAARKDREREELIAEERRIVSDAGRLSEEREARVARDKQNRLDRRETSRRLVETTARQVAEAKTRELPEQVTTSEVTARTDERRKAETEKRKQASLQRYRDYNESVQARDIRPTGKVVAPDFDNRDNDAINAEASRMKMLNMRRLGDYQRKQAEQKSARESQERSARLSEPTDRDTMYFLWDNEW